MSGCGSSINLKCNGPKTSAECQHYGGEFSVKTTIPVNDQPCASTKDVIEDLTLQLNNVYTSLDLSGLSESCFNYNNNNNPISIGEALLKHHAKLLEIMTAIGMPCENGPQNPSACAPVYDTSITCLGIQIGSMQNACQTPVGTLGDLLKLYAENINYILARI